MLPHLPQPNCNLTATQPQPNCNALVEVDGRWAGRAKAEGETANLVAASCYIYPDLIHPVYTGDNLPGSQDDLQRLGIWVWSLTAEDTDPEVDLQLQPQHRRGAQEGAFAGALDPVKSTSAEGSGAGLPLRLGLDATTQMWASVRCRWEAMGKGYLEGSRSPAGVGLS